MLSTIAGSVITQIANSFIGKALDAFVAYNNKQISLAELQAKVQQAMLATFAEVEKAYADSLNKTFDSFMKAAVQSKIMQYVWAAVAVSQLIVLLWHQMAIPALVYFFGGHYPSSGDTTNWAYALVMFCLGGGAIAMKVGPNTSAISDQLKSLTKK